eukprot:comp19725_c0_seq1/m.23507 comp19725_c0_seq1/g.23507  ORF comp19725_c0_seq1/g.23507 comp19725_c0_seq1/m.23507 type:complete len:553 (-) comp19725_c0_seq1:585-2243(-)
MNKAFGFGKKDKHDKDKEKIETSAKNETLMLKLAVSDAKGFVQGEPKAMRFDKKETAGEVLARGLSKFDLTGEDYHLFKSSDVQSKQIKDSKVLGDCKLQNNDTLYIIRVPKEVKEPKDKDTKDKKRPATPVQQLSEHLVFGKPLLEGAKNNGGGAYVYPAFVEKALAYVEKHGMDLEGIFRLSGTASEITAYKDRLDNGEDVDFSEERNAHNVAGLTKLYLRELPEPLLTWQFFLPFMAVQDERDEARRLGYIRALVGALPPQNYTLLKRLCGFFHRLADHSAVTKMHYENLATVLGPNILKREGETMLDIFAGAAPINAITHTLLANYNDVFENDQRYPVVCVAITEHAWLPQTPDELNLKEGDVVFVYNDSNADGWWEGFCKSEYGYFPANYVKVICKVPEDRRPELPPPTSMAERYSSIGSVGKDEPHAYDTQTEAQETVAEEHAADEPEGNGAMLGENLLEPTEEDIQAAEALLSTCADTTQATSELRERVGEEERQRKEAEAQMTVLMQATADLQVDIASVEAELERIQKERTASVDTPQPASLLD